MGVEEKQEGEQHVVFQDDDPERREQRAQDEESARTMDLYLRRGDFLRFGWTGGCAKCHQMVNNPRKSGGPNHSTICRQATHRVNHLQSPHYLGMQRLQIPLHTKRRRADYLKISPLSISIFYPVEGCSDEIIHSMQGYLSADQSLISKKVQSPNLLIFLISISISQMHLI